LHCALVGRQAGYGRFDERDDFLPHGFPVLQSIQPLPRLRPNHLVSPPLFLAITSFCL
jgi:hypothetical protein